MTPPCERKRRTANSSPLLRSASIPMRPRRGVLDGQIDWRMSSRAIYNLVRALTRPYPGAHFLTELSCSPFPRSMEGRRDFARAYEVAPWGTGFCYDVVFIDRVVGEHTGHVEVLGINCGLGGNSLSPCGTLYVKNPPPRAGWKEPGYQWRAYSAGEASLSGR